MRWVQSWWITQRLHHTAEGVNCEVGAELVNGSETSTIGMVLIVRRVQSWWMVQRLFHNRDGVNCEAGCRVGASFRDCTTIGMVLIVRRGAELVDRSETAPQ